MPLYALVALLLAAPASAAKIQAVVQDKYGKPVADAVVYLATESSAAYSAPETPFVMDQVKQEFVPRVLAIPAGGKVSFPNSDNIHHHLFSFSETKKFEVPLYKGKPADPVAFDKPGIVKVGCNIHDWMAGVIVVLPSPSFAKTDAKGAAQLEVPDGEEAVLEVFHPLLRGEPKETRKTVKLGEGAKAEWKLPLKMDNRKKRPASYSNY